MVCCKQQPGDPSRSLPTETNALLAEQEEVNAKLAEVRSRLCGVEIADVWYYGSGCAIPRVCRKMDESLRNIRAWKRLM